MRQQGGSNMCEWGLYAGLKVKVFDEWGCIGWPEEVRQLV